MPQLAGGLVFGAGFVIAGLCPGTSCVAAATGRGDGAMVVAGLFMGVLVTGLAFAPLRAFYESTSRGTLMLPEVLRVPYGVVVFAVVIVALRTRPDGSLASCMSCTDPLIPSPFRATASVTGRGPQRCTGERALQGSSTAIR